MSGSAESTPDAFTVAVKQVLQLHQDQMRKLQCQLQMQYQLSAQQQEQITELKKQLRRMKGAVSHAKSKVKHQSKLIHDLRKCIPATLPGSLLKCGSSPSTCTDQSGELSCTKLVCSPKPIGSPKRKAYTPRRLTACDESSQPETPLHPHNVNPTLHNAHTNTVNKTINRTCVSLFSSSPISLPHTPATTQTSIASLECQEETDLDATAVGATEVSSLDSTDLQTSGSSSNDVIIVEDITRFNPGHTPCQAPTQPAPSPQFLFGASTSMSSAGTPHNIDMEGIDGETGIEEEEREEQEKEEEKEEGDEGEDEAEEEEEGEEEEERNISFPSRILPLGSGTCKGLSLRDGTGRFRYKELNRNTNSSVSASNSRNTVCDTYMTGSSNDFPTKVSKLASSPESCSPPQSSDHSSHSSSATSPSSPSILRSSGSPWKQPRSPVAQVSTVVPSTRPGPQIPKSDSQLSLDISHTIPPSPELHTTSAKEDNRCVDPPFENKADLLDQQNHAHPDPHPQGGQLCKSTKPPIAPSSRSKRPKKKVQHFKQPTLTQTVGDLSPSTGKHLSGNKQCSSGVKQLNSSISDGNNVSLAPTVVLATPGTRPVSNIVGASFHVSHESMLPRVDRDPPKRMLVCQEDQGPCQDLEDVLPCKKARRLDSTCSNEVSNLERTVIVSDDDVTRIIDLPSEDSEEEPSPVFNPPVVGSGDLSSNEPCSKEEGHDAPMNPVADENIGNGSEDINLPMDQNEYARTLAAKAGLPTDYKYAAVIRKKSDRDKLDAKPCPDCQAWFAGEDGIHGDKRQHLMHTCRHKDLHLPPDSDPAQWEISFPSTEKFEQLM